MANIKLLRPRSIGFWEISDDCLRVVNRNTQPHLSFTIGKLNLNYMKLNKIIQGDCIKTLETLPDKSVDIIITSPPYNLGNDHHTGNKRTQAYDDNLPEVAYQINQCEILKECYRVLKDDGSMFYNHKNRIKNGEMISPYMWIFPTQFTIKQELVWFNGSQNFDKIRFYPMTERVYWLTKSPETKLFNAINHHDFFTKSEWPAVGAKGKHTRAFPVEFVKDILKCFPDKQIVLDPYMGSGTTALAAKEMGKDYLGIEISEEYIKLAEERLANN